jgi:hypothetical protein
MAMRLCSQFGSGPWDTLRSSRGMAAIFCDTGTPVLVCAVPCELGRFRRAATDHNDVEYSMRVSAISHTNHAA